MHLKIIVQTESHHTVLPETGKYFQFGIIPQIGDRMMLHKDDKEKFNYPDDTVGLVKERLILMNASVLLTIEPERL